MASGQGNQSPAICHVCMCVRKYVGVCVRARVCASVCPCVIALTQSLDNLLFYYLLCVGINYLCQYLLKHSTFKIFHLVSSWSAGLEGC